MTGPTEETTAPSQGPDAALLDLTLGDLLDRVAAREPAPGGGAVAGVVLALAAGLAAMAARFSDRQLTDSAALARQADALRHRAGQLADQDAAAYRAVLAAYRTPGNGHGARQQSIRAALARATELPLQIAETGAEVADLGVRLSRGGNPNLAGDATAATVLADAAVRVAADLARINIGLGQLDEELSVQADRYVARTAEAVRTAARAPDDRQPRSEDGSREEHP